MPVKLKNRERLLLYLAISFIAIFISYNFFIKAKIDRVASDNLSLAQKELLLKKNLNVLSRKESIKKGYAAYSKYIREPGSEEKELTVLLKDIESLASVSGLRITNLKPRNAKKETLFTSYEVELDCDADIIHLAQFFSQLDSDSSFLKIKRLRLSGKENAPSVLKINMTIDRLVLLHATWQ